MKKVETSLLGQLAGHLTSCPWQGQPQTQAGSPIVSGNHIPTLVLRPTMTNLKQNESKWLLHKVSMSPHQLIVPIIIRSAWSNHHSSTHACAWATLSILSTIIVNVHKRVICREYCTSQAPAAIPDISWTIITEFVLKANKIYLVGELKRSTKDIELLVD